MMKTILFLFLPFFASSQSWQLVENMNGFITDIEIINGERYTTFKTGELLQGDSIIATYPVQTVQECGLLSVGFWNGSICVYLSSPDSVQRLICGGDTLLSVSYKDPWSSRHRGGDILYTDSTLFVSTGYGSIPGDAQDTSNLRGKILSVTDSTVTIFAIGLRNPWKMHLRSDTIYIADVGWQQEEEVSRIDTAGINLGWPCYEGYIQHDTTCSDVYFPYFTYPRAMTGNCIIGGKYFQGAYWWCDNYYKFGGKVYENGLWDKIPCPQYPDGMYVQGDSLFVYDYTGKIYLWTEGPLSIDSMPPKPDPVIPPWIVITNDEIKWSKPINGTLMVLSVDNKIMRYEDATFRGSIDLSDFVPGIYVLCIIGPHGLEWSKLFTVIR